MFSLAAALSFSTGCRDYWFGEGNTSGAEVRTPSGTQSGIVSVDYVLTGEPGMTSVTVSYSTDGRIFRDATQTGGTDTTNVPVSKEGEEHRFEWDSGADLGGERHSSVVLRVSPADGNSGRSGDFAVHNARFLAGVDRDGDGRTFVYWVNGLDGEVEERGSVLSSAGAATAVIFHRDTGLFLVAHESSNAVSSLRVNEEGRTLVPAAQSQAFGVGGAGSKELADDANVLFVLNIQSAVLNVFDVAPTGAVAINANSGLLADGWIDIAVEEGRLFALVEGEGQDEVRVAVHDVGTRGALVAVAGSPFVFSGVTEPSGFVLAGEHLFIAERGAAALRGVAIGEGGRLSELATSPSALSTAGLVDLVHDRGRIFGVPGLTGDAVLVILLVAESGAVTEDAGSPFSLQAPASAVVGGAGLTIAPLRSLERLDVRVLNAEGRYEESAESPVLVDVALSRLALSD